MIYKINDFARYNALRKRLRQEAIDDGRAHVTYFGQPRFVAFTKDQKKDFYDQIAQDNTNVTEAARLLRERQIVSGKAKGILFVPTSTRTPLTEMIGGSA